MRRPPLPHDRDALDAATLHAAENVLVLWVRSGLSLLALGFLIERFGLGGDPEAGPEGARRLAGIGGLGVMGVGVLVSLLAAVRYVAAHRLRGRPSHVGPLAVAAGTALVSVLAAVVLVLAVLDAAD
jgi:putative membrane protein